jgi:hypothetical protein
MTNGRYQDRVNTGPLPTVSPTTAIEQTCAGVTVPGRLIECTTTIEPLNVEVCDLISRADRKAKKTKGGPLGDCRGRGRWERIG